MNRTKLCVLWYAVAVVGATQGAEMIKKQCGEGDPRHTEILWYRIQENGGGSFVSILGF